MNWSSYNNLKLDIHSLKNTGSWINLIISDASNAMSCTYIEVNWTGWKRFEFDYNRLFSAFNSSMDMDWNHISYFAFESHPTAYLNIDKTQLCIGSLTLEKKTNSPTKYGALIPYQKDKSILFPSSQIQEFKEMMDTGTDELFMSAVKKIEEGKNRFLNRNTLNLEDLRDAIFYGKLFEKQDLVDQGLLALGKVNKDFWDDIYKQNDILLQNNFINYVLCADLLKSDLAANPKTENTIQANIKYMGTLEKEVCQYWINYYPYGKGNNHATRAACALGIAAICYPSIERADWYWFSLYTLDRFFEFQISEDGVLNEGTHYYLFIMEVMTYFNHFLMTSNQLNLFADFPFSRRIASMVDWSIKIRTPNGYLPSIDDSWQTMVSFPGRFLTPFFPNRDVLCWSSNIHDPDTNVMGESWNVLKPFYIPMFLLSIETFEKPKEPNWSPCFVFNGDSQVIFRDSWKEDGNYLFASGKKMSSLHEQDDTGNIQIFSNQAPILLESGYGPLGWISKNREYYVSASAHNVMLINDKGPKSFYNGGVGPIDGSDITDFFSFSSLGYTNMHINTGVQQENVSQDRSIFFVPQSETIPFYSLVIDHAKSDRLNNYKVLFHPNGEKISVSNIKTQFKLNRTESPSLFIDLIPLHPCSTKVNKGFYSPYWEKEIHTEYVSFEQESKTARFATLIFPHTETSKAVLEGESNGKGNSNEYSIQMKEPGRTIQDFISQNSFGEIRQLKFLGTNAKLTYLRKIKETNSLHTLLIKEGSYLNLNQNIEFFATQVFDYLYLAKKNEIYKYYCEYSLKDKTAKAFFKILDFDKIMLDNQEVKFQKSEKGVYIDLPAGKHSLTFY